MVFLLAGGTKMTTTENKDEVVSVELPAPAAWKKLVFFGFFLFNFCEDVLVLGFASFS